MSTLADRLSDVKTRVASAAQKHNRSADEITLIVVSKNHPAQLVVDLLNLGQLDFGENKDQEAAPKAIEVAELAPDKHANWHFVGQLQSNKVRSVIGYATSIHSLDRPSLLTELNKQLAKHEVKRLSVFIELNLTADENRGGVSPDGLEEFAVQVLNSPQLDLLGVMGVASLDGSPEADFERIAKASQRLQQLNPQAKFISAGMSADFELAIGYGATHIRVGTAITGKRE